MLISFFVCPIGSHAAYIIHLKSGGRFVTPQYWVEDNKMICFFVSGGTMGIEKDSVRQIEKSSVEPEYFYEAKKSTSPPVTEAKSSVTAVKGEVKKEDAKTEPSSDPNKDPAITNEFQQLQNNFAGRHRLSIDELNTLKNGLIAFSNKISAQKLEDDFAEEFTLANDMKFHVNNLIIIKKRQQ